MTEDKVRENKLRRMAERQGRKLEKSRRRDPRAVDYGGYMLLDARTNAVIAGDSPFAYSLTLDDVEAMVGDDIHVVAEPDLPVQPDRLGRPTLRFFSITYPMDRPGPGRGWYLFTTTSGTHAVYRFLGGLSEVNDALHGARRHLKGPWELVRVDSQHYELVNRTGKDAVGVRMAAVGPLIIEDRKDWSATSKQVTNGQSVQFSRVHGWSDESSGIRVSWSEDGVPKTQTVLICDLDVYPRPTRP